MFNTFVSQTLWSDAKTNCHYPTKKVMNLTKAPGARQRMPRYRLYIDESGDHTYNKLDDIGHRYLALLGVWFKQQKDYLEFVHELEQFKNNLFGERPDSPVILHRTDIINRRGAFGILC